MLFKSGEHCITIAIFVWEGGSDSWLFLVVRLLALLGVVHIDSPLLVLGDSDFRTVEVTTREELLKSFGSWRESIFRQFGRYLAWTFSAFMMGVWEHLNVSVSERVLSSGPTCMRLFTWSNSASESGID